MAEMDVGAAPQKRRKPIFPIAFVIISFLSIIWLFLLYTNNAVYDEYGMDLRKDQWIWVVSIIIIGFIAILMVFGVPKAQPAPVQMTSIGSAIPTAVTPAPIVTEAQAVPMAADMSVVEAEPIVVEAEIVEAEIVEEVVPETKSDYRSRKPRLIDYPKKVPGGVYGDTVVRVDPRTKLNLRTLLVRSCMICDRQGKCWEEIQDRIPRDDFLANIECKKGLR